MAIVFNCPFAASRWDNVLFAEIKFFNDSPVTSDVGFVKIVEQTSALTYQTDKASLSTEVLFVRLQVFCEVIDAVREEGDLAFC